MNEGSRPVGAHLEGKLKDRYEAAEEARDVTNKSAFLRELIRDALDARELSPYERAGISQRLARELGSEYGGEADEEEVLRDVVERGLQARQGDALDAIGAGGELRGLVEAACEEGEDLDEGVRRLLREGAQASIDGSRGLLERGIILASFVLLGVAPVLSFLSNGWGGVAFYVIVVGLFVAFDDILGDIIQSIRQQFRELLSR